MSAQDPFAVTAPAVVLPERLREVELVEGVATPLRMEYLASSGRHMGAYLRAMKQKRIIGERCPTTGQVFVPPRGATPTSGLPTTELVEVADRGYVESFCVTRVPIPGRDDLELPYVSAWIVLDGANVGFIGLVTGIAPDDVKLGLRVEAVWRPDAELTESANNISSWIPTGEPDHVIESYEIVGTP